MVNLPLACGPHLAVCDKLYHREGTRLQNSQWQFPWELKTVMEKWNDLKKKSLLEKRLCTVNVSRSNERKLFHIKRGKKHLLCSRNYADVLALFELAQAEFLLHSLEQAARGIDQCMNLDETEFICFYQDGAIFSLNVKPLKLVNPFIYFSSNISSPESDVNILR